MKCTKKKRGGVKREFEHWRNYNFVVTRDGYVQTFVRINKRRNDNWEIES